MLKKKEKKRKLKVLICGCKDKRSDFHGYNENKERNTKSKLQRRITRKIRARWDNITVISRSVKQYWNSLHECKFEGNRTEGHQQRRCENNEKRKKKSCTEFNFGWMLCAKKGAERAGRSLLPNLPDKRHRLMIYTSFLPDAVLLALSEIISVI